MEVALEQPTSHSAATHLPQRDVGYQVGEASFWDIEGFVPVGPRSVDRPGGRNPLPGVPEIARTSQAGWAKRQEHFDETTYIFIVNWLFFLHETLVWATIRGWTEGKLTGMNSSNERPQTFSPSLIQTFPEI